MPKRKTQENDGTRLMAVRVPVDQADRFKEIAERDHRTVSHELRRLIEQRIGEEAEAA